MKRITSITLVFILVLASISGVFADNEKNDVSTATAIWNSVIHTENEETREVKITLTGVIGKQVDDYRVAYEEFDVKYLDKLVDDEEYIRYEYAKPTWNGVGDLVENGINVIPVVEGATLTIETIDDKGTMKFPIGSYPFIDIENSIICNGIKELDTLITGKSIVFDRDFGTYYEPFVYQFPIHIQGNKLGIIVVDPKGYPIPSDDSIKHLVDDSKDTNDNNTSDGLANFKDVKVYSDSTFSDVKSTEWYSNAIKVSYSLGIMGGKGNNIFDPSGNIKVSEAIAMVTRTKDIFSGNSGVIPNTGEKWYDGFVQYAIDNDIITDGQFENYDRNATRAELAYLFANAMTPDVYAPINKIDTLPDVDSDIQYGKEIFMLYNAGIVTGSDSIGTFKPTADITRAEASAIINRVIRKENRKAVSFQ